MTSLDQRVCNCSCHTDGREDCADCCAYKAQVERDVLQARIIELRRVLRAARNVVGSAAAAAPSAPLRIARTKVYEQIDTALLIAVSIINSTEKKERQ